ncbi:glycosyltransferase family 2 protein [Streptomyces zhihengii]|uniref:Glycosyltransferase family 2 protein n=1 Tax=Streptomyces zhihengii TaxID=1818004 RepID=A0ABS2V2K4_9ACTN|nr:galactosyltransferase-related protein [Streptomyces zhihengii]MBM9623909.1 glycosyltransferase family 2 protein [Streptomyces zhihengii]
MNIAVITPVAGRHSHLRLQHAGLRHGGRRPDHYVVVAMGDEEVRTVTADGEPPAEVIDVPVRDGRLPLAAARNAGAHRALTAGADLLVFLDVDCVPSPTLLTRYADAAAPGVLLCGPVAYLPPTPDRGYRLGELPALASPHPARPAPPAGVVVRGGDPRLFWSLSFALTAHTWRQVGGFCEQYTGYGGEDTDFAATATRSGVDLWWVGGAEAYHQHHPVHTPPVHHLDDILRNGALYKKRWGSWPMLGWLREFARMGLVVHHPATDTWRRTGPGQ